MVKEGIQVRRRKSKPTNQINGKGKVTKPSATDNKEAKNDSPFISVPSHRVVNYSEGQYFSSPMISSNSRFLIDQPRELDRSSLSLPTTNAFEYVTRDDRMKHSRPESNEQIPTDLPKTIDDL